MSSAGAPRTLVISDLHLGAHTQRDVLRRDALRAPLLATLHGYDRLVLLGDVVEMRHGHARDALAAAEPVLRDIGEALGAGREVVIVPGNHDHHLTEPWLERRSRDGPPPPLELENAVDHHPGEALARIARWLGPAEVRCAYPGVWLREDVYALHGHYCDRHTTVPMFERLGAGAMARIAREPAGGPHSADDYEAVLSPLYAWLFALAQVGGPELGPSSHGASAVAWRALSRSPGRGRAAIRKAAMGVGFKAAITAINRAGIGPVRADVSGPHLRRAALHAIGEVLTRLQIGADHVLFGHTHRAGRLAADEAHEWHAPTGSRLHNTGCWVYEGSFIGNGPPAEQPYWPGRGLSLPGIAEDPDASAEPELVSLLEGVELDALRPPRA